MNQTPTPITNRLRRAQQHSDATLYLLHQVGRVELYARHHPRQPVDYAVVRGRLVGHGPTPGEALGQVRAHLQQLADERTRPLAWRDGLEAGFSSVCLHHFCQAYHLAPTDSLTRAQLTRLLSQPEAPHRTALLRAVARLGIHLKPTS